MQRRSFLKLFAATAGLPFLPSQADTNILADSDDIRVLVLEGSPRNRGNIHGESLRSQIQGIIAAWRDMLQASTGLEPDAIFQDIVANTGFKKAVLRYTPEFWEELEGVAEGADVPLNDLFVLNLPDEHRWYLQAKLAGIPLEPLEKCTTLGFDRTTNSPALIGQNMDIPSASEGFGVLLDIRDNKTGIRSMLFSVCGIIGIIGMNNQPVGIGNNSLKQLDVSVNGLPINFVLRGLLQHKNAPDAIGFLKSVPHATGHNWMIGDKERVRSFECSGSGVVEFDAPQFPGAVYHTNHPFVQDISEVYKTLHKDSPPEPGSSEARCAVLEALMKEECGKTPSVEFIKATLSNQDNKELPISRAHNADEGDATYTAASLVMELSDTPKLYLAPGPPSEVAYKTYSL